MRTCRTPAGRPGTARRREHGAPRSGRPRVDVRVSGDLDLSTAPDLAGRVLALVDAGADVGLDAGEVAFADCCGLAALERCLAHGGGRVRLLRSSPALDRLVELVAAPDSPLRPAAAPGAVPARA